MFTNDVEWFLILKRVFHYVTLVSKTNSVLESKSVTKFNQANHVIAFIDLESTVF
jgi:hypothetical protein